MGFFDPTSCFMAARLENPAMHSRYTGPVIDLANIRRVLGRRRVTPEPSPAAMVPAPPSVTPPPASVVATPNSMAESPHPAGAIDIFATIERLAELRQKGVLTEEEFAGKKSELLSRL
jgi:Short C-terminal domain